MALANQRYEILVRSNAIAHGEGITHGGDVNAAELPDPSWVMKPMLVTCIFEMLSVLIAHNDRLTRNASNSHNFGTECWKDDLWECFYASAPQIGDDLQIISRVKVNPTLLCHLGDHPFHHLFRRPTVLRLNIGFESKR